jgi:hypothetical protein
MNQLIKHYLANFAEKLADAPGAAHLARTGRDGKGQSRAIAGLSDSPDRAARPRADNQHAQSSDTE